MSDIETVEVGDFGAPDSICFTCKWVWNSDLSWHPGPDGCDEPRIYPLSELGKLLDVVGPEGVGEALDIPVEYLGPED